MKTRRNNKRPKKHGRKTDRLLKPGKLGGKRKTHKNKKGGNKGNKVMYPLDKFLRDSECAYIKDFISNDKIYQAVMHFINDVIVKLSTCERNKLLTNLSNVYVLIADIKQKEDWRKIMNDKDYSTLEKNGKMIVAYMLLSETAEEKECQKLKENRDEEETKSNETIIFIDWIDTIVRGYNLATYIIGKYESERNRYNSMDNQIIVLPSEILSSARGFWADWFDYNYSDLSDITDDTGKIKSEYIDELKQQLNVNEDDINWKSLYYCEGLTIDEVKKYNSCRSSTSSSNSSEN